MTRNATLGKVESLAEMVKWKLRLWHLSWELNVKEELAVQQFVENAYQAEGITSEQSLSRDLSVLSC